MTRVSRIISSPRSLHVSGFSSPPIRFGVPHPTPEMVTKTKILMEFWEISTVLCSQRVAPLDLDKIIHTLELLSSLHYLKLCIQILRQARSDAETHESGEFSPWVGTHGVPLPPVREEKW